MNPVIAAAERNTRNAAGESESRMTTKLPASSDAWLEDMYRKQQATDDVASDEG